MTESTLSPIQKTTQRLPGINLKPWQLKAMRNWSDLIALAVGAVCWELLARWLNFQFFPPLSVVLQTWWSIFQSGSLFLDLLISLKSLMVGYSLAVVMGLALGILMGRFRKVEYFFDPLIDINLSTPTLVYVPVLFALFGVSPVTQYVIVFMYAFFIIVVNTTAGIKHVDSNLLEMARSFGASEPQLFRKIMMPAALPMMMAGVRIGMSRAVKGMLNGEMFIALVGIGAQMRYYSGSFQIDKVLALLLTLIVIAVVATSLVQRLDRRLTGWAETIQD